MIFSYLFGIMQISFMESRVILKVDCAIAKFKAIDYYRKSTKTVEIISDELHISTEKSAEDELIVMEDRKNY